MYLLKTYIIIKKLMNNNYNNYNNNYKIIKNKINL